MMSSLKAARIAREILDTRGDHIRFAVQVDVHAYPEDFVAVWIMIAVTYSPFAGLAPS